MESCLRSQHPEQPGDKQNQEFTFVCNCLTLKLEKVDYLTEDRSFKTMASKVVDMANKSTGQLTNLKFL